MFKYLLYFLNLIFVIGGILLIVVGSIMLSTMGNFTAFEGAINTQTIPIIIITIGCVTFLVAFFGCCGTIRENACCTTIFKCCGNTGYQQYESSVPASCCGYKDRNQVCEAAIYTQRLGCNGEFVDFWASNTDLIRWSSLIIALFELGIFIVSCCLASAMRKR
ncbi:GL11134 [Drosophila persimilis]|uniref:GL11134 n=1 Tax=Drosophila persimilis TaxID=7234 RepID=B4GCC5_DROPE|nr:GL11134 [Drosophila persimilis]